MALTSVTLSKIESAAAASVRHNTSPSDTMPTLTNEEIEMMLYIVRNPRMLEYADISKEDKELMRKTVQELRRQGIQKLLKDVKALQTKQKSSTE